MTDLITEEFMPSNPQLELLFKSLLILMTSIKLLGVRKKEKHYSYFPGSSRDLLVDLFKKNICIPHKETDYDADNKKDAEHFYSKQRPIWATQTMTNPRVII